MNRTILVFLLSTIGIYFPTGASSGEGFNHPGLLHSEEDLRRMRHGVSEGSGPIHEGFQQLSESPYTRSDYRMRGPRAEFGRAPNIATGETQSDAQAAYQNALMWAVTGRQPHADKAIEIVNAWIGTLKKVSGIDGVLASGLQGFKFANAAELLRHTPSGWPEEDALRCEEWFENVWDPTIRHYAYFANGNWETAALQTRMAMAVFRNDRQRFEETVRYAVNGAGNGSIPHLIVSPTGQTQETTRAQHYAQLGLGLLGSAAEVAWNQGVDLYGWRENRILQGFEYTAKYGLGEDVSLGPHLDRTGKYGTGGRHQNYTTISTLSRGRFQPIFERTWNHYANRRGLTVPYAERVTKQQRPEGFSRDHVGLGTLAHWRPRFENRPVSDPPGIPAGLVARSLKTGLQLSWVGSVDPVSGTDAGHYFVERADHPDGPFVRISKVRNPAFTDAKTEQGQPYHYRVVAGNRVGTSPASVVLSASAGLPGSWKHTDVGAVDVPGFGEYNGRRFSLEGHGHDIAGREDSFHFVYAPFSGQGTITARIVRPMSSQWTKPGVMMRESLEPDARHASVLLLPHWSGALVTRSETGGPTSTSRPRHLGEAHIIKKNRLSTPYWVRVIRFRNRFTGYLSSDGIEWRAIGSAEIPMARDLFVGFPACSQLNGVATRVTYDRVSIPTWRQTEGDRLITARPEPRWHQPAWQERHAAINKRVREGDVDLLMIGDSITHWWDKAGRKVWDQYYGDRRAVNLGISGDRTEHVLWRLENGNIEGISPRAAVLMIGTNNHMSSPPEVTARDTRLIVEKLRTRLPETRVLVLAIFPRGGGDDDGARQTNMKVNELIREIGDGDEHVQFLNLNSAFLNGRRLKQNLLPDGTHPNAAGYAAWAEAMEPTLAKLLETSP
ncbi:MAG: GDSL-type esterase/lipase family protein [Verrucomicrobiota bacterium]